MRVLKNGLLAAAGIIAYCGPASAVELRTFPGYSTPYGELSQLPNDDGSSNELDLPFSLNFFGTSYDSFFVNNNGNISFGSEVSSYTPSPFPSAPAPMIAPFWADVDTTCSGGCGAVYIGSASPDSITATWNNVGYFFQHSDLTNNFQMTLFDRSSTGAGNFDIEFRYDALNWSTGDASGGENGLGGTPAQAGYDAGNGVDFFTLPGSFESPGVLRLAELSNVSESTPGLWQFQIRNGSITVGDTPETPLLPDVVTPEGYQFNFNVDLEQRVFIDPIVAIGYDYTVVSGPNILDAIFPTIPGDSDGFEIFTLNGIGLGIATPGSIFSFGAAGVAGFQLRDIDTGLDPLDTTAFVTGLSFVSAGAVDLLQTPFTIDTGSAVPEPASWAMMIAGFGIIGAATRRRRTRATLAVA